jgi:hypothetical protein
MEGAACVTKAVLASSQLTEVLCGLRDNLVVELERDTASWLGVHCDVKLGYVSFGTPLILHDLRRRSTCSQEVHIWQTRH